MMETPRSFETIWPPYGQDYVVSSRADLKQSCAAHDTASDASTIVLCALLGTAYSGKTKNINKTKKHL